MYPYHKKIQFFVSLLSRAKNQSKSFFAQIYKLYISFIKMKIAIFTDTFVPQINGVVTFILQHSKSLADKGHKIYIIAPIFTKEEKFSYKNITVIRLGSIPALFYEDFKFTMPFSLKLLNYIKKEKIELIHFQTPSTIGMQAVIISKILKIPLIGTYHTKISDLEYLKHAKMNGNILQKLSWAYARGFYNKADLITCPTEDTKEELLEKRFKQPIKAVSNGIDLSIFKKKNKKQEKKEKNLLFIGRIAHEKNIDYLIDCFNLALKKKTGLKLIIVGDGPQINEIKKKVKEMKKEDKILFPGRIEHEKLIKSSIFDNAYLFVTASTTETQGISTLEAQAKGIPAIGINKGGIKNLIIDNYNGFLLELGDKARFAEKIIKLINDKKLYNKMKKNTLKEIKRHDLNNIIKVWEKEYSKLINKSLRRQKSQSLFTY